MISGFEKKNDEYFNVRNNILYDVNKLYPGYNSLEQILELFEKNRAIIDYLDTSEEESSLIATVPSDLKLNKYYTHCEIDPSVIFGVMGNSIIYPESNQFPRDCFSCGQSRQAVSVYHSNAQMRMDKMGVLLNYGQTPLIKSRYLEYINHEEQPYGVNAIVAIMCYTGYNVEDAILINEGSIKRGIFRTTYYTTYEAREESSKVSGSSVNTSFANIQSKPNVKGLKEGFDYSKLDKHGLVQENTPIDEKVVLIGEVTSNPEQKGYYIDNSKTTKKGQLGFVDKAFMSEGEEGFRIAKIRIREERLPAIGDKMASRAGQKGTLGLIIPEEDMPFTADGLKPDLIINPHAIPSRMTIGQLIESLFGKACCMYGGYGDCTAFATNGANYNTYGPMLNRMGYHRSGNQVLYSGFTGEQIYSEIFIGPTYYMRLKHMVKDKINYRATGKRNFLTRQTNQGRANDGGLKIGEMERDGIMANGLSYFLNESYMVRGDQYYMAVCNMTGTIAIYNLDKNLFLSPFADGPIVFNKNVEGQEILNAISKFGRSFSIVRIPFALKLLIQELQVMNIQMRIITEDNIDQLTNLSFQSRNIDKLLNIDHGEDGNVERDIKEIVENYKTSLYKKMRNIEPVTNKPVNKIIDTNVEPQNIEESISSEIVEETTPSPEYPPSSSISQSTPEYYKETILEDGTKLVEPKYKFPDDLGYYYMNLSKEEKLVLENESFEEKVEYLKNIKANKSKNMNENVVVSETKVGGGIINIFPNNPDLNDAFNKLGNDGQSQILQMNEDQRLLVMKKIMDKSKAQTAGEYNPNQTLNHYFETLPMKTKLDILKGGYKSVSTEFSQLAGKVDKPLITINTPESIQEQLTKEFPLLAVEKSDDSDKMSSLSDHKQTNTTSSDNTSSSDTSSSSNVKTISFA